MAFPATHCTVGSQQRKPRLLVKGRDILDEPCGRCVASFAIFSQCLVVQIGMTIQAFPSFVLKYQRLMTIFAVSNPVLAHQPEFRCIVIEFNLGRLYQPVFGGMTLTAINPELLSMGRGLPDST
jgi:hypothetical protein